MSIEDETLILESYSEKFRAAVEDYFAEFSLSGENAREDVYGGFSYTWLYIRERDGRLLGMLNIRENLPESSSEIGNIGYAIRPTERRKGYGRRLCEAGTELCRMLGMTEISASVRADNTAGLRVIESAGFKRSGRSSDGRVYYYSMKGTEDGTKD